MSRSMFIANRLQEVLLDGRWIANTNCKTQIENITWEQAIKKIGSLNSIAALTYHLNYYLAGILQVFDGGNLEIRDKYSFDLPPIQSEKDWKKLTQDFIHNSEKFVNYLRLIPES